METPRQVEPFDPDIRDLIKRILLVEPHLNILSDSLKMGLAEILPGARIITASSGEDVDLINSQTGKVRTVIRPPFNHRGKPETINEFHPDLIIINVNLPGEKGVEVHKRLGSPPNTIFRTHHFSDKEYLTGVGLTESDLIADKYKDNAAEFKRLITEMLQRQEATVNI